MEIQFPIQNFISAHFWDNGTHNTPDNRCGMITRQIAHDEENAYLFPIFSEKVKIFPINKYHFCAFLGPNNHGDTISRTKCHVCQFLGPSNQSHQIFRSKLMYAHFWDQITTDT